MKYARILLMITITVAATAVGVFAGRALRGSDDEVAINRRPVIAGLDESVLVEIADDGDIDLDDLSVSDLAQPVRVLPVLEPVMVSFDESAGDELLEIPPSTPRAEQLGAQAGPAIAGVTPVIEVDSRITEAMASEAPPLTVPVASTPSGTLPPDGTTPSLSTDPPSPEVSSPGSPSPTTLGDEPPSGAGGGGDEEGVGSLFLVDLGSDTWRRFADLFVIDPCAGTTPGLPVPESCPPGIAATMGELMTPPAPMVFFSRGHYLEDLLPGANVCPSDTPPPGEGQYGLTVWSWRPLESLEIRYRPYGSSEAWVAVEFPASSAEQIERWNSNLAEREIELEWAVVPICVTIDRPGNGAYAIEADTVDIFAHELTARGHIMPAAAEDELLRPPTTARISTGAPVATVQARTLSGGTVRYRTRVMDHPDDTECSGTYVPDSEVLRGRGVVRPIQVYDSRYNEVRVAHVDLPPGAQVLVCAEIYPTRNPLNPVAVDKLVITSPTQQRPRIVLQGIRRHDDRTITAGSFTVQARIDDGARGADRCSRPYTNDTEIPPGAAHRVEETIWQCSGIVLPVDDDGYVAVPVTLRRRVGSTGDDRVEEIAIPIRLDDCAATSCERPSAWYEIPIPWNGSRLCGTGFGSDGCSDVPTDGIAVIRVDYERLEGLGGADGSVTLIDQVDVERAAGEPRLTRPEVTFRNGPDGVFVQDAQFHLFSDRPMRLGVRVVDGVGIPGEEWCYHGEPGQMTDEFADEFNLVLTGLCAGSGYEPVFFGVDEDGVEYEFERLLGLSVPSVSREYSTRVRFLGGADAEFGYFYRFGVELDGQSATNYFFDHVTGDVGSHPSCMALEDTLLESRGRTTFYLRPTTLELKVYAHVTTTGDGDCSGRSGSGFGEMTFRASFDEFAADEELVFTTPPDAPFQFEVRLTPVGEWRR